MSNVFKGIIPSIIEGGNYIEYDPSKGITKEDIAYIGEMSKEYQKYNKPEYILSKSEAEALPLWQLTWLGENNKVLCSLEVSNIINKRFKNEKK